MTNHAAKLLIKDATNGTYFIVHRANHPKFGNSVDLPGGTVEAGESALQATIREVKEEIGAQVSDRALQLVYSDRGYSPLATKYSLFYTTARLREDVKLSWEHIDFAWVTKEQLIKESRASNDRFMHMVADTVEKL